MKIWPERKAESSPEKFRNSYAERDIVALGIAAAAILLFVGIGSEVLPRAFAAIAGNGAGPQLVLVNALLLNIALIIFGMHRHRQLQAEVTEWRQAEKQARELAETAPLTSTMNRRSFGRSLDSLIHDAKNRGECVAVMMLDLDNFKQINDRNGHGAGDLILLECARRIDRILPNTSILARVGGDEFACAIPFDRQKRDQIDVIAARIADAIAQPITINSMTVDVSTSVGIAQTDAIQPGMESLPHSQVLLDMADVAMYHAKRQGRNSFFWFEDFMADEMRFRSGMESGIREGLANNEFVPFFEPQIDVQTGKVTGFEMLARWNSPKFGLVKPDIFIPIAEDIGLIAELSETLIARALQEAKEWHPDLTLAVNISPVQLRDPWFAQKLLKILVEANFPPNRLEIEITESCVHEDLVQVRSLIASLKNQGIKVSLDDFGTGYSTLAQLRLLPFDRIKIDRSFVTSLAENKDSAVILKSIALLGKGLGLPITAEGIENDAILAQLRGFGDIKGQGYHYGQPKSAAETREWLAGMDLYLPAGRLAEHAHPGGDEPLADPAPRHSAGNR